MQSAKFKRILGAGLQQVLLITVAVSQIGVSLANAQGNSAAREQLLAASEALTVDAILEAALVNAPAARSEVSLRAMSEAFDALGNSWVASRPSLQISVYDDSPLDNIGLQEFETGVSFNLWRPGERSDTAALGDQHQTRLEAWREHLQLLVAGQVRAVLGELAAAERRLEIAQQASADAERLLATTVDMEAVGAAAQSDVLQARTQSLQQQRTELQALADLASIEQAYTVLTGLNMKPAIPYSEVMVSDLSVPQNHPTLRYLQSQVAIAAANVELTRHQTSGRPSMTVGVRRERGDRFQPYNDSLALSFSVPFGKSPATVASVSLARGVQTDAEVEMIETRRQLEQRRGQVGRELELIGESLVLGREQVDISEQRYEMALTAFELGEMDLTRVIFAQQQARQAELDYESLRLREQRLNSEYNQIIGVLP